jgi:two-component sensor histidine kinase
MIHDEPVALSDIYKDPRIPADAYRPTFVHSLAVVPVRLDRPIAAIGAYWSDHHEASEAELETLRTIADAAALALARARQRKDARAEPAAAAMASPGVARQGPGLQRWTDIASFVKRLRRSGLRPNSPEAYAFAVISVAVATGVRMSVGALGVHGLMAFTTYYPAVIFALIVGGARAGALAAVLGGALADVEFLPAYSHLGLFDPSRLANLALYFAATGLMIAIVQRYRTRVRRLADEDARHLTLARELEHRAKTSFAIVQAIVMQSLPGEKDKAKAIAQRIRAAVAEDIDPGPGRGPEDVRDLLEFELEPFGLGHVRLKGPELDIGPKGGASLALAVHEMATNAVKYGALSTPDGRVTITWSAADGAANLRWVESGGPPVTAPQKRGFGSVFLQRVISAGGGSIAVEFSPGGVEARISLPLKQRVGAT